MPLRFTSPTGSGAAPDDTPRSYRPTNDDNSGLHAKAAIDGVRVPLVENCARVEIRKDGPTDLSRRSKINVPIEWIRDTDWHDYLRDTQIDSRSPIVDVYLRTHDDATEGESASGNDPEDGWRLVHRGPMGGFGSGAEDGLLRVEVEDFGQFLNLPAEFSFVGATVEHVLREVVESLSADQHTFDTVELVTDTDQLDNRAIEGGPFRGAMPTFEGRATVREKRFTPNRDTYADVLRWITGVSNTYAWFEPTPSGIGLVVSDDPTTEVFQSGGFPDDRPLTLLDNSILRDTRPINQVVVRGEAQRSVVHADPFELSNPAGEYGTVGEKGYLVATATHDGLVEQAGGTVVARDVESSATSIEGIRNEARKKLKKAIDTAGIGKAQFVIAPSLRPYDGVTMHPTASRVRPENVEDEPLAYEMERVVHTVSAREPPLTECRGSVYAPLDEISVDVEWRNTES